MGGAARIRHTETTITSSSTKHLPPPIPHEESPSRLSARNISLPHSARSIPSSPFRTKHLPPPFPTKHLPPVIPHEASPSRHSARRIPSSPFHAKHLPPPFRTKHFLLIIPHEASPSRHPARSIPSSSFCAPPRHSAPLLVILRHSSSFCAPPCHSARSEAESQNLLNRVLSQSAGDSATPLRYAQNDRKKE